MTTPPASESLDDARARVADELARLTEQVARARAELDALHAKRALLATGGGERTADVLAANEQLVVAAVRAQEAMEVSSVALNEASRAAGSDPLTGLTNRVLMRDRLGHAIETARRHRTRLALLFVDLDEFKQVNDAHGHAVGDEVLRLAAEALRTSVRGADTVSRHGGDEFLVLLTDLATPSDAEAVADKALSALSATRRVGTVEVSLTASIGISLFPDDGDEPAVLIDRADTAMYHAKRVKPGHRVLYSAVPPAVRLRGAPAATSTPHPFTRAELARAEHVRRHDALREANEHLVLAVLSAQEKQAAAEATLKRHTELLSRAADELRSPLNPIRRATALLGMTVADTKLLQRAIRIIDRQVGHIARLVGDLLDVTRLRTGTLKLDRVEVDLRSIVDDAAEHWRSAIDVRRQRLVVRHPERPIMVHGDPIRLVQILHNLLDNASRYTPERGAIHLSVEPIGDHVVVALSDNGIGIPPESLLDVFELFKHAHPAGADPDAGLGIGLSVVRELVEAHDGTVRVHSDGPGQGTKVEVSLPIAPRAHDEPTPDRA
jgi:diguanylate cyclase